MFTIDFIFYKTGTTNKKLSVAPVNITYYIFKYNIIDHGYNWEPRS